MVLIYFFCYLVVLTAFPPNVNKKIKKNKIHNKTSKKQNLKKEKYKNVMSMAIIKVKIN